MSLHFFLKHIIKHSFNITIFRDASLQWFSKSVIFVIFTQYIHFGNINSIHSIQYIFYIYVLDMSIIWIIN